MRVYEQFSTVDAISNGRVEMIPGRGSAIESFPLFGHDLGNYDRLFSEKLELLLEINRSERVHWSGTTRSALQGEYIPPRAERGPIPIWLGVGGHPGSAVRVAQLGLPMATGVLGGDALRPARPADLYRRAAHEFGNGPEQTLVMLGSPGFLMTDGGAAREHFWPYWRQFMTLIGEQRGFPPPTRASYDRDTGPRSGMLVGSPEEIAEPILLMHQHWGHVRQYVDIDTGGVPQKELLHAIELFGTKVRPMVQAELRTTTVDQRLGRTSLSPRRDDPGARSPGLESGPGAASVVRIGA